MRMATAAELPAEQELFRRSWDLLKKYRYIAQADADAWADLVGDLGSLGQIGTGTPCGALAAAVALSLANYLEQQSKLEA